MTQHGNVRVEIESESATSDHPGRVLVYEHDELVAEILATVELKKGADGGFYNCVTLTKTQVAANIGAWEKMVAKKHKLHESWLVPSHHGSKCYCCGKLRINKHYCAERGICVFCSVACTKGDSDQQCDSSKLREIVEKADNVCKACGGTGGKPSNPCKACNGTGRVRPKPL